MSTLLTRRSRAHIDTLFLHAMTTSHALCISEVLDMILDHLIHDKLSLCYLAFTCKDLAEPTLDRLWALNDSLEPFIPLLPNELVLNEDSFFEYDPIIVSNLLPEKWAIFNKYARRARRLYARTVTMRPHRVYSSIYQQLTKIRPNAELFPNLITLVFHAKNIHNTHLRMFPSSLRCLTLSWANVVGREDEGALWSSVMDRLFQDAPFIERIHFEGSPREPVHALTPLPFQHLQEVRIKPSPIVPNVLHKYSHALSASTIRELDLRFVRWPDQRLRSILPVFPALKKLTVDGSPSRAFDFIQVLSSSALQEMVMALQSERGGEPMSAYAQLFTLLADKYRGVFRTLEIQYPLHCQDQGDLEVFLRSVQMLADAGLHRLNLSLILGWPELTQEVRDMIDPSKWAALGHFRISTGRVRTSWSW